MDTTTAPAPLLVVAAQAGALSRALTNPAIAASPVRDARPALEQLRLVFSDYRLTVTGTNSYLLIEDHAEVSAANWTGSPDRKDKEELEVLAPAVELAGVGLKLRRRALADLPVTIEVTHEAVVFSGPALEEPVTVDRQHCTFPTTTHLWPTLAAEAPVDRVGLNGRILGLLGKVDDGSRRDELPTLSLTFSGPLKPIKIGWIRRPSLRALVMPVRIP